MKIKQSEIDTNFTLRALQIAINTLKGLRHDCTVKGKQKEADDYTIEINAMQDLHGRLISERLKK